MTEEWRDVKGKMFDTNNICKQAIEALGGYEEYEKILREKGITVAYQAYQKALAEIPVEERLWAVLSEVLEWAVGDRWWRKRDTIDRVGLCNSLSVLTVEERARLYGCLPKMTCEEFLWFMDYFRQKNEV